MLSCARALRGKVQQSLSTGASKAVPSSLRVGCQQVSACDASVRNLLDMETQACRRASAVLALRLQLSSWCGTGLCFLVRRCDRNRGEMRNVIAKMGVARHPIVATPSHNTSFLAFCQGAILDPGRFLDSPGTPLSLFLGREAAWVLLVVSLSVVCCLSPSALFAAAHVFLPRTPRNSQKAPRNSFQKCYHL